MEKNEDGGLDYDTRQEIEPKEKPFDPFITAYTTTFNFNIEELPEPKSLMERILERLKRKRQN